MVKTGSLEKARGKVALEPGFSLMAWMRLCKSGADLTGGAGLVDEDEDEEAWPKWSLAEVTKHGTPDDAWMVLRGKVYNITLYLKYHPGGVDTLLEAAGADGTALFDKYHAWVNAEGILTACCVGTLSTPSAVLVTDGGIGQDGSSASPEQAVDGQRVKRVKWDEPGIKAHDAQRGVMFGATTRRRHAKALARSILWPASHSSLWQAR